MTTPVSPVDPSTSANPASQASDPSQAQAAAMANQAATATTVANISELREKAGPVYKALLMGIAMRIRSEQEASMRRFKEEQRKSRG